MLPVLIFVSNRMLPVSRSLSRTCQGSSLSGKATLQPSLKSNLRFFGPCCVGSAAGAGYARLGTGSPEVSTGEGEASSGPAGESGTLGAAAGDTGVSATRAKAGLASSGEAFRAATVLIKRH